MIEKVNPSHPDKLADRIAGAVVDLAYAKTPSPWITADVLLSRGRCHVLVDASVPMRTAQVSAVIRRIAGDVVPDVHFARPNPRLAQAAPPEAALLCPSNGIYAGVPLTAEQKWLSRTARKIYTDHPDAGTYLLQGDRLTIYQGGGLEPLRMEYPHAEVLPLENWNGSPASAVGTSNRRLSSDLGDSVGSGGLHGRDLSNPDVSLSIYAFLLAQKTGRPVQLICTAGDSTVCGTPYSAILQEAWEYIRFLGGFEKLAEWGLY